ncbi:MAG: NAD-dependent deacetylase [Rubripirellula sp.]
MRTTSIAQLADVIRESEHVVVFTGAGMSAESGIPTFRDDDGFWKRFPIEEFASWKGIFKTVFRRPRAMSEFVYEVIQPIAAARPNAGHLAVEQLEHHTRVTVVTQNVDGLHQLAGNTVVHEIHGSLFEVVSLKGRFRNLLSRNQFANIADRVERSRHSRLSLFRLLWAIRSWLGVGWRGIHRPKVVLFGDSMAEPDWAMAWQAVRDCDCLIQVGCSGVVLPAAMLPIEAKDAGATIIAVDPQPVQADLWYEGKAGEVLPRLIERLVSQGEYDGV